MDYQTTKSSQLWKGQLMQWRDTKNRPWSCRLTIADVKRLKASGCDIADPKAFEAMFANPLAVIELISEAMRTQWQQAGLTYEDFAELLTETEGKLIEVQQAFAQGLADFFRRLGENAMAVIVEKAIVAASKSRDAKTERATSQRVDKMIQLALDKEEKDFQSAFDAEEAKLSGKTSTSEPVSLESTQAPGLIES